MQTIAQDAPLRHLICYAASQAAAKYDSPGDVQRIGKAVALVLAGHVDLLPTGGATVRSGTCSLLTYYVNGTCECPDFGGANGDRCKHRYAKAILSRALALYPLTYYAIWSQISSADVHGLAVMDVMDWTFLAPNGEAWSGDRESIQLLGNVLLSDHQRVQDGDLVRKVTGYY